jgi:hypothetical protein
MNYKTQKRQQQHLTHRPAAKDPTPPVLTPMAGSALPPPAISGHVYTPIQLAIHEQFHAVGGQIRALLARAELKLMMEGLREGRDEPTPASTPAPTNS